MDLDGSGSLNCGLLVLLLLPERESAGGGGDPARPDLPGRFHILKIDSITASRDSAGVLNRYVRIIVAVLGCLHLCGGHWGVLQVVAWSKMIADYSAQDGLIQGAAKTFDGEHPCRMCKAIAEGKKQESKEQGNEKAPLSPQSLALKECVFDRVIEVPLPASRDLVVLSSPDLDFRGVSVGHQPTVPPPRAAV